MYAKLIDRYNIITPPSTCARPDGTLVTNYNAPGNIVLWTDDGFRFVEECQKPDGNYRLYMKTQG